MVYSAVSTPKNLDDRLKIIYKLASRLAAASMLEEVFEAALDALMEGVRIDRASLLLFDSEGVMRFRMWRGLSQEYRNEVEGHSPWTREEKDPQPICVCDMLEDESVEAYRATFQREGIRALGFFPLVARGELLGKFMIYAGQPTAWDEDEIAFVEAIAANVAFAVELTRVEQRLIQAQRMDSLGTLSGSVAHDFNNLLTPILGYGQILRQEVEQGTARLETVDVLLDAARRAAEVTRQLLAFARRQPVSLEVLNLASYLQGSLDLLRRLLGPEIELVFVDRSRGPLVKADPTQLRQVLINLAANGRDAMPQGGELTLELSEKGVAGGRSGPKPDLESGDYVVLTVKDDGQGMDEPTRQRVFEPFFTTKSKGRGTGLGMSTAYGIVRQTGGDIHVESTPGRGSSFFVYLPRHQLGEASPAPAEPARTNAGGMWRILVVDDEPEVRRVLSKMLRLDGHETIEAEDGAAALEVLRAGQQRIDLVLSDVLMPRVSGRELLHRLRRYDPYMPFVFMSGFPDSVETMSEVPFIAKPVRYEKLRRVLAEALAERHSTVSV